MVGTGVTSSNNVHCNYNSKQLTAMEQGGYRLYLVPQSRR